MATTKTSPKLIPPPPPPPATTKAKGSSYQQFVNYWSAHGYQALKGNAPDIQAAANAANVDPIYFASLLLLESGANYKTSDSSKGAIGIGQLEPGTFVGQPVPWDSTRTITLQDLKDPTTNLRLAAYHVGALVGRFGYAGAYSGKPGTYNPYYTGDSRDPKGAGPQAFIQKWSGQYVPATPSTSPPGPAGVQVPGGTAPATNDVTYDRWAVLGADGRVKFVKITNAAVPPKNVLHYGPTPLTQTGFINNWKQVYQDTFFSYTGRQASGKEIANILKNVPTLYTLANVLMTTKSFATSPSYKAHAPGIIAIAKQKFGDNWKVDKTLVGQAIAQNWDQATLEEHLRERPEYENGPAFKTTLAQMDNTYQQIYGASTDPGTQQLINHVAKDGWSQDQFAAFLRTQPEYKGSQEFKSKAISFAQQLGLITGNQVTLTAAQAGLGGAPAYPAANTPATPPPAAPAATVPPGHGSGATPYIRPTRSASGGPS